jgi:hypothetical protein
MKQKGREREEKLSQPLTVPGSPIASCLAVEALAETRVKRRTDMLLHILTSPKQNACLSAIMTRAP